MATSSTIRNRHEQMFPLLEKREIARLERFGERHTYPAGSWLVKAGNISPGFLVILSGHVEIRQPGSDGELIVNQGLGGTGSQVTAFRPPIPDPRSPLE